jgi:hypothetical protein
MKLITAPQFDACTFLLRGLVDKTPKVKVRKTKFAAAHRCFDAPRTHSDMLTGNVIVLLAKELWLAITVPSPKIRVRKSGGLH